MNSTTDFSKPNIAHTPNTRTGQMTFIPPTASAEREVREIHQENARLRLALRELRHRSCNQWQMLVGLAEMECMQHPQNASMGCIVRLRAMTSAFATLNSALDNDVDVLAGNQTVCVRSALESILALLKTTTEENNLHFVVQDAWLPEKGCAALMLICAELVCNAVKYGRQTTQITFRTQSSQGILEVRDDGPGFPVGFRVEEQGRQGLQLVEVLCRFDLNGEMRCQTDAQGGVVTVTFPALATPGEATEVTTSQAFCAMKGVVCFDRLSVSSQ
jgi:two-component sensor histidine kinase